MKVSSIRINVTVRDSASRIMPSKRYEQKVIRSFRIVVLQTKISVALVFKIWPFILISSLKSKHKQNTLLAIHHHHLFGQLFGQF
jgi:hypothetical protein